MKLPSAEMSLLPQTRDRSARPSKSSATTKGERIRTRAFCYFAHFVAIPKNFDHCQVCRHGPSTSLVSTDDGFRNYTGDILNFGLAKEQFVAQHPDKADKVKFLVVGDDVAVGRTQGSIVGRR